MSNRIPAEVFSPGEFLRDELDARGWTQTEFAEIITRPVRLVNEVISGKKSITPETALEFSAALGTSAQFWMNLETSYQLSRASKASDTISRAARIRELFPVREMIKRGWIEHSDNVEVLEHQLVRFFGLSSIDQELEFSHAARRNDAEELSQLQIAWLFRVRKVASVLSVSRYSQKSLLSVLETLELFMDEPEEIRHVPEVLATAGVRFVVVEPMPSSKIEGVCFWLEDNTSPVIGLSMRLDRIDNFWFNLRHEIEHILNEDGKDGFIIDETDDLTGAEGLPEAEIIANRAAAEFCTPQKSMDDFIARLDPVYPTDRLIGFARLMSRHPGIVVGQLQRKTERWELFRKFQIKVRQIITQTALTDGYGQLVPVA